MLRPRVGVRARVDQHRRSPASRDHDRDARPEDTRKPADVEQRRGEHGTRVPRGDDGVGVAVADGLDGPHERRIGLRPDGLGGLLVHLDRVGACDELEPLGIERWRPEQDGSDRLGGGCDGARDDLDRRVIAAQGVDRDADRHGSVRSLLGSRRPQRPDLAPAVRLARRAGAVRLLRRAAVLARRDARRADGVLRSALVATRLRGLALRNGHERLAMVAERRGRLSPIRAQPAAAARVAVARMRCVQERRPGASRPRRASSLRTSPRSGRAGTGRRPSTRARRPGT